MTSQALIEKYNVPAPRYTSYPTVPLWNKEGMSSDRWLQIVKRTLFLDEEIVNLLNREAKEKFLVMEKEGLLNLSEHELQVTETGKAFIRNIAMVLDVRLHEAAVVSTPVFSKAI